MPTATEGRANRKRTQRKAEPRGKIIAPIYRGSTRAEEANDVVSRHQGVRLLLVAGAEPQEEAALQAIPVLETLPLTPRHVHQHVPRGVRWATYFERGVLWMREVPRV